MATWEILKRERKSTRTKADQRVGEGLQVGSKVEVFSWTLKRDCPDQIR